MSFVVLIFCRVLFFFQSYCSYVGYVGYVEEVFDFFSILVLVIEYIDLRFRCLEFKLGEIIKFIIIIGDFLKNQSQGRFEIYFDLLDLIRILYLIIKKQSFLRVFC